MKIGIFTETYHPTVNGVVVSIDTFKDILEKKGHEYYIFAPYNKHQKKKDPPNVFRFPAIHFKHDPIYPLAIPMPFFIARGYFPIDIIRKLDIIHIQHYSYVGQYALKLAEEFEIPAIYTYHTMAELYSVRAPIIGSLAHPIIRALTRYTARHSDHMVTPTESVKHYLKSIGVTQPISVIPTGIYTNRYKRTNPDYARAKFSIPDHQDIIMFVGRLGVEKNIHFLLEAFEKVIQERPNTHLLLVGDGPDRPEFASWITEHKLDNYITITGFQDREETIKLFGTGELFVFPSVTDTQGIVILEAMASGAPPIAINVLGPHDLVANGLTGKLTRLNVDQFSDTIIDLLNDDKKREHMATTAREYVKRFDASVTGETMEKLYEQVIAEHSK